MMKRANDAGRHREPRPWLCYSGWANVTSVTDGDGNEVAIYEYDSFGNVLTEAGSLANEFKFSTKQADKRGQLIDFGFRWYDAEIGQ